MPCRGARQGLDDLTAGRMSVEGVLVLSARQRLSVRQNRLPGQAKMVARRARPQPGIDAHEQDAPAGTLGGADS